MPTPRKTKTTKESLPQSQSPSALDLLANVNEPQLAFWVNNGPVCENLRQMAMALSQMTEEQFNHHTEGRNDFANWLRDVIGDTGLAHEVEYAEVRSLAAVRVMARVIELEHGALLENTAAKTTKKAKTVNAVNLVKPTAKKVSIKKTDAKPVAEAAPKEMSFDAIASNADIVASQTAKPFWRRIISKK